MCLLHFTPIHSSIVLTLWVTEVIQENVVGVSNHSLNDKDRLCLVWIHTVFATSEECAHSQVC